LRKRESSRYRKPTEHKTVKTKKRNTPRHIIIKTLSTQNKERILKAAKRNDKSCVKANPLE
jgi:hypothetical protein